MIDGRTVEKKKKLHQIISYSALKFSLLPCPTRAYMRLLFVLCEEIITPTYKMSKLCVSNCDQNSLMESS